MYCPVLRPIQEVVEQSSEFVTERLPESIAIIGKRPFSISQTSVGAIEPDSEDNPFDSTLLKGLVKRHRERGCHVNSARLTSRHTFPAELSDVESRLPAGDGTRPPVFELTRSSDVTLILPEGFTEYQLKWLLQMSRRSVLMLNSFSIAQACCWDWQRILPLTTVTLLTNEAAMIIGKVGGTEGDCNRLQIRSLLTKISRGRPVELVGRFQPHGSSDVEKIEQCILSAFQAARL